METGFGQSRAVARRRRHGALRQRHQSRVVGLRQELTRRENDAIGATDASESFDADQAPSLQVDFGLIPELDPVLPQGIGEQHLDNSSRADPSAHQPVDPSVTLADALRQNWVEFWYQPKIDLQRRRLVGVEALARIRRPDGVVLAPGQFLPQADDAALMALTESAMTTAARDGAALSEAGFHLQIAVNVPASALLKLPIPAIVREYRSRSGPQQDFILEVNEDQIIDNLSHAFEVAIQLKIYGIKLSLDDIGHGYSSLARLKALPFAELKIDRSFVADCDRDKANFALCKTVVELAHRFECAAVAEGIERAAELETLQNLGCDQGQGFLIARPMPKDQLIALLRERAGRPCAIGDWASKGVGS